MRSNTHPSGNHLISSVKLRDDPSVASTLISSEANTSEPFSAMASTTTTTPVAMPTTRRVSTTRFLTPNPRRRSEGFESLTIDKLRFSNLRLFGREAEMKELHGYFDSLASKQLSRIMVFIDGYSGTGKSALADTLKQPVATSGGVYVSGKHDLHQRHEHYSAIVEVCSHICGHIFRIQSVNSASAVTLIDSIRFGLGSELPLFVAIVSALGEVLDSDIVSTVDSSLHSTAASPVTKTNKDQIHFLFRRFFRVVSQHLSPLVVVLDDLQWIDQDSLDLLESLVTDNEISSLMIVATYRSNEVNEEHMLKQRIRSLSNRDAEEQLKVSEISVGNLNVDAVIEIISHLLSIDRSDEAAPLARICMDKTNGNVFFLLQFLVSLKDRSLLNYCYASFRWNWNVESVCSATNVSENVLEMLNARMSSLPKSDIGILRLAALMGSSFYERHLNIVWTKLKSETSSDTCVSRSLDHLEGKGYVQVLCNNKDDRKMAWSHDKLQEAALFLLPKDSIAEHRRSAGEALLAALSEVELDASIYMVVGLLGSDTSERSEDQCLQLASLHLVAGKKAISFSAFRSASTYAKNGIALLPSSHWTRHPAISCDLFSVGAQAERFLGDTERLDSYYKEVSLQSSIPETTKLQVLGLWSESVVNRLDATRACSEVISTLERHGCRFPNGKVMVLLHVLSRFMRIKSLLNQMDLEKLGETESGLRVELMELLDKLAMGLYLSSDHRVPLIILRGVEWTGQYGYSDYSSVALATTGMMALGVLGKLQLGSEFGERACAFQQKLQSRRSEARTRFLVNSFLFSWTRPLHTLMKPLLCAYECGMETGDTESAMWAIYHRLMFHFVTGQQLEQLHADCQIYCQQMQDLKNDEALRCAKSIYQVVANLTGRNEGSQPSRVVGKILTEHEEKENYTGPRLEAHAKYYQGTMFSYFGEYVEHADLTLKVGPDYLVKAILSCPKAYPDIFLKSLSCFAAARLTKKRKYGRMAVKLRKKIKKWLDSGCVNAQHYNLILEAEFLAYRRNTTGAITAFQSAIKAAAKGRYIQDAALACERLADLYLEVLGNRDEGMFRLKESVQYWKDWGAIAKVEYLEQKYPGLHAGPTSVYATNYDESQLSLLHSTEFHQLEG